MINESTYRLAIDATHLELIEEYLQLEFDHKLPLNDKHSVFMVFTNGLQFFNLIDKMNDELIEADESNDYTLPTDGLIDGGDIYDTDEMELIRHDESINHLKVVEMQLNDPVNPDPNERLMNAIFPDQSINTCGNCALCMNKDFNPFCLESNKCVQLNKTCNDHERG
jgi:hypothetical protein